MIVVPSRKDSFEIHPAHRHLQVELRVVSDMRGFEFGLCGRPARTRAVAVGFRRRGLKDRIEWIPYGRPCRERLWLGTGPHHLESGRRVATSGCLPLTLSVEEDLGRVLRQQRRVRVVGPRDETFELKYPSGLKSIYMAQVTSYISNVLQVVSTQEGSLDVLHAMR